MDRAQALSTLDALWDADTEIGARLLVDVVSEMGYAAALTDAALIRLARAARDADAALERHRAGGAPPPLGRLRRALRRRRVETILVIFGALLIFGSAVADWAGSWNGWLLLIGGALMVLAVAVPQPRGQEAPTSWRQRGAIVAIVLMGVLLAVTLSDWKGSWGDWVQVALTAVVVLVAIPQARRPKGH